MAQAARATAKGGLSGPDVRRPTALVDGRGCRLVAETVSRLDERQRPLLQSPIRYCHACTGCPLGKNCTSRSPAPSRIPSSADRSGSLLVTEIGPVRIWSSRKPAAYAALSARIPVTFPAARDAARSNPRSNVGTSRSDRRASRDRGHTIRCRERSAILHCRFERNSSVRRDVRSDR